MIVAEEVVHVDALRREELGALHVAQRELEVRVAARVHDEGLASGLERGEHAHEDLGLDGGKLELVDDREAVLLHEEREGALQRARADLEWRTVRPVTGTGRVRLSTTDVVRSTERALTSAAGALLFVELLRGAGDGSAFLCGSGALTARRELGLDDLVEEMLLDLGTENFVREGELSHLLALQVVNGDFRHCDESLILRVALTT